MADSVSETSQAMKPICRYVVHDEELHATMLSSLCRTCGNRALLRRQKRNKNHRIKWVKKHTDKIKDYFGIDTSEDFLTVHPDKICNYCYNSMITCIRNPQSSIHRINKCFAKDLNDAWIPFKHGDSAANCPPCTLYLSQRTGGRPRLTEPPAQLSSNN